MFKFGHMLICILSVSCVHFTNVCDNDAIQLYRQMEVRLTQSSDFQESCAAFSKASTRERSPTKQYF